MIIDYWLLIIDYWSLILFHQRQFITVNDLNLVDGSYFISIRATNIFATTTICHHAIIVDSRPPILDSTSLSFHCDHSQNPSHPFAKGDIKVTSSLSGVKYFEWGLASSPSNVADVISFSTRNDLFDGSLVTETTGILIPFEKLPQGYDNLYLQVRAISWSNLRSEHLVYIFI